jgi:hypothetical protein
MDDLKINKIKKKFINTKEKFTYLFGLLIDNNLNIYAEEKEISSLFEIDSSLDMLNITLNTIISNIEMFDNEGILSNNLMDYSNNTYTNNKFQSNYSNDYFSSDSTCDNEYESSETCEEPLNETENIMGSFVSSLKDNNSNIPKVLFPMILYTYMTMDPESILNKEHIKQEIPSDDNFKFQYSKNNTFNNNNLFNNFYRKDIKNTNNTITEDLD